MKKKFYIAPAIDLVEYAEENELLVISSDEFEIGYGGVDDGLIEASSRELEY